MVGGYERATNEIIPAVRSALIRELKEKYKIREEEISNYLEITQAAVSKYLNERYSEKIKEIEERIDHGIIERYAKRIADGDAKSVNLCICTVCNVLNAFDCRFSYVKK